MKVMRDVLLAPHDALSGKRLTDFMTFSENDQGMAEKIARMFLNPKPIKGSVARVPGFEPRHVIAATMLAFERNQDPAATTRVSESAIGAILTSNAAVRPMSDRFTSK